MTDSDLAERLAGIAVLADPIRRDLYLYVGGQPAPVSRDQAADGLAIARHTAKFHLDKLAEEGLLDISFKRLSDRRGPGAGRPTKLYARSSRELSVTLPERRYDIAGLLLAGAIDSASTDGTRVTDAVTAAADQWGASNRGPSPRGCRFSARFRTACRLHLRSAGPLRVRTRTRRRHHRAEQLPLRHTGARTHPARLRHEPRHHGRCCRSGGKGRARCPPGPRTWPMLCRLRRQLRLPRAIGAKPVRVNQLDQGPQAR
jgi:hypothetical protein